MGRSKKAVETVKASASPTPMEATMDSPKSSPKQVNRINRSDENIDCNYFLRMEARDHGGSLSPAVPVLVIPVREGEGPRQRWSWSWRLRE